MDEQRRGPQTTEFWVSLATGIVSLLASLGVISETTEAQIAGLAGMVVTAAFYAISRAIAKWGGVAILFVAISLTTVGCQSIAPEYVAADRATYEAIAPAHRRYVEADDSLTQPEKDRRYRLLQSWRLRLEQAEVPR